MENDFNAEVASDASTNNDLDTTAPDTKAEFEAWLDKLRPRKPIGGQRQQSPSLNHHKPDFFVSCTEGSCQISFEGVFHIEGFVSANIRSETGTLVTGGGLIDGNIDVGAAYIDGSVIGNIRASERVVLYSEAKVAGNIISPALSTKPGALFEGDCILHDSMVRRLVPISSDTPAEFSDQL
ncbi:MAG TPA: polymer-forming cytoskeletal protein [Pyrinomonadaceae bacterium]|nr:polymer-forming cytoskeletal protein [Pyrinomonadaceae bacterium]